MRGDLVMWPAEQYVQNLYHQFVQQMHRIEQAEKKIMRLETEVAELKQQRQIHVENINYHFDQLKIEQLEGILNIGISPENGKSIEDLAFQTIYHRIKNEVDRYIHEDIPGQMMMLEERCQVTINQDYREKMILDMRNQVEGRIHHYLRQPNDSHKQEIEKRIIEQIKTEIYQGLESHYQNLSLKRSDASE
jgi:spore germination protein PC